jgi:tetratricopeptide (TPR) repeat protein
MQSRALAAALSAALGFGVTCVSTEETEPPAVPLFDDLGTHHHPISTSSASAQAYFDQGLVLTFGFNHEQAVRSFRQAAALDPDCAICWWGVALALGPNINAPMGPDAGREAWAALERARALAPNASAEERAYIEALAPRYAAEPPDDRSELDRAYADAMRALHERYPEDLDAATLYAEALMDLMPWDYWTPDGQPREHTPQVLEILELVLARDPQHPGANHYYIHAVEEFFPEKGVPAAERLRSIAPDAGHLVHMPSHIFFRVGRYADAQATNDLAIAADEAYFAWCRSGGFYRAAYYPHNVHFLWAAASMAGRSDLALTASRKLAARTEGLHAEHPFVEEFLATPLQTLVRFGRWDAVLGEPRPADGRPYQLGIWHYARGVARVRLGALDEARAELAALRAVAGQPAAAELIIAGGTSSAATLLQIGAHQLAGEIAAAGGAADVAVAELERAVSMQDALVYMEPPPWYFPVRQALGAVLLDAGRPRDAEAVYRVDLKKYPANGWSLFGLARSLEQQGRADDAALVERGFLTAWQQADVTLGASRF